MTNKTFSRFVEHIEKNSDRWFSISEIAEQLKINTDCAIRYYKLLLKADKIETIGEKRSKVFRWKK